MAKKIHKKKKRKHEKQYIILIVKNNENIFLLFTKKWFLKEQKTKTSSFPQISFLCFLFLTTKKNS